MGVNTRVVPFCVSIENMVRSKKRETDLMSAPILLLFVLYETL